MQVTQTMLDAANELCRIFNSKFGYCKQSGLQVNNADLGCSKIVLRIGYYQEPKPKEIDFITDFAEADTDIYDDDDCGRLYCITIFNLKKQNNDNY